MPASSRKRNKGKERKAKKAAEKEVAIQEQNEVERRWLMNSWQNWIRGDIKGGLTIQCSHGLEEVLDESHPVSSFITTFFMGNNFRGSIETYHELWNNHSYRKLAAEALTIIGANWLLSCKNNAVELAGGIASGIFVLENYNYSEPPEWALTAFSRVVALKNRDLDDGFTRTSMGVYKRDLLKFFRKRMKCSCLKKMHLEARKAQSKLGKCHHCKVEKERVLLMVCSRCRIDQYCSRKCQVAASPDHREDCDVYVMFTNGRYLMIYHTDQHHNLVTEGLTRTR